MQMGRSLAQPKAEAGEALPGPCESTVLSTWSSVSSLSRGSQTLKVTGFLKLFLKALVDKVKRILKGHAFLGPLGYGKISSNPRVLDSRRTDHREKEQKEEMNNVVTFLLLRDSVAIVSIALYPRLSLNYLSCVMKYSAKI